jgi:hypothetical protein
LNLDDSHIDWPKIIKKVGGESGIQGNNDCTNFSVEVKALPASVQQIRLS